MVHADNETPIPFPAGPLVAAEAAVLSASLLPAKAPEPALVVGEDDIRRR